MDILIELLKHIVIIFLMALQTAMTLRAILSWFMMGGNKFMDFLYAVTEPFVYPVRALFQRMNWLQGTPIDFSFMITYLLISLISLFLS
ncbi:MAG: YggT family protein [Ruminococcaceae bacterium]|nr:YggT family protein [Oscillospiraceae bacterium]